VSVVVLAQAATEAAPPAADLTVPLAVIAVCVVVIAVTVAVQWSRHRRRPEAPVGGE